MRRPGKWQQITPHMKSNRNMTVDRNMTAEEAWQLFEDKYPPSELGSVKNTYAEISAGVSPEILCKMLSRMMTDPNWEVRRTVLALMNEMPVGIDRIRVLGTAMKDEIKFISLQAMIFLSQIITDDPELLEELDPFLDSAAMIVERDALVEDQSLRSAAAAMLVRHHRDANGTIAETLLRNIHPNDKFVMHLSLELGLNLGIIEDEREA